MSRKFIPIVLTNRQKILNITQVRFPRGNETKGTSQKPPDLSTGSAEVPRLGHRGSMDGLFKNKETA